MDSQQILSSDYLDLVFQDRNKKYGSYELRKNYNNRAHKALLTVLFICSGLSGILFFHKTKVELPTIINHKPVILADIQSQIILPPEPSHVDPPTTTKVDMQKLTDIKIVKDDKVQPKDEMPTVAELHNQQIGTETINGTGNNTATPSNAISGTGTGIIKEPVVSKPLRYASVMPEFDGELSQYLQAHLKYPALAKENNIQGKVAVEFIVNEDGSISNAVVKKGIGGGCDEEALRVINSMPHWKPGKQNDKTVKVFLVLPIIFQLQ